MTETDPEGAVTTAEKILDALRGEQSGCGGLAINHRFDGRRVHDKADWTGL